MPTHLPIVCPSCHPILCPILCPPSASCAVPSYPLPGGGWGTVGENTDLTILGSKISGNVGLWIKRQHRFVAETAIKHLNSWKNDLWLASNVLNLKLNNHVKPYSGCSNINSLTWNVLVATEPNFPAVQTMNQWMNEKTGWNPIW